MDHQRVGDQPSPMANVDGDGSGAGASTQHQASQRPQQEQPHSQSPMRDGSPKTPQRHPQRQARASQQIQQQQQQQHQKQETKPTIFGAYDDLLVKRHQIEAQQLGGVIPLPSHVIGNPSDQDSLKAQVKIRCDCSGNACLKLYCKCFASGIHCKSWSCGCSDMWCRNNALHEEYSVPLPPSMMASTTENSSTAPSSAPLYRNHAVLLELHRNVIAFRSPPASSKTRPFVAGGASISTTANLNSHFATADAAAAAVASTASNQMPSGQQQQQEANHEQGRSANETATNHDKKKVLATVATTTTAAGPATNTTPMAAVAADGIFAPMPTKRTVPSEARENVAGKEETRKRHPSAAAEVSKVPLKFLRSSLYGRGAVPEGMLFFERQMGKKRKRQDSKHRPVTGHAPIGQWFHLQDSQSRDPQRQQQAPVLSQEHLKSLEINTTVNAASTLQSQLPLTQAPLSSSSSASVTSSLKAIMQRMAQTRETLKCHIKAQQQRQRRSRQEPIHTLLCDEDIDGDPSSSVNLPSPFSEMDRLVCREEIEDVIWHNVEGDHLIIDQATEQEVYPEGALFCDEDLATMDDLKGNELLRAGPCGEQSDPTKFRRVGKNAHICQRAIRTAEQVSLLQELTSCIRRKALELARKRLQMDRPAVQPRTM